MGSFYSCICTQHYIYEHSDVSIYNGPKLYQNNAIQNNGDYDDYRNNDNNIDNRDDTYNEHNSNDETLLSDISRKTLVPILDIQESFQWQCGHI